MTIEHWLETEREIVLDPLTRPAVLVREGAGWEILESSTNHAKEG